jgi:hypothetical protein
MYRVVQDANRSLSVGRLSSATEAEDQITARIAPLSQSPTVHTTIDDGIITTRLSVPAGDLDIIGWYSSLASATVTVTSQHFVEY